MLSISALIPTVVNIIFLFLLLRHFLFQPIQNVIEKRKELVEGQLADAREKEKQAQEHQQQYADALQNARKESAHILETARCRAKEEHDIQIAAAQEESSLILDQARSDAELEQKKVMNEVSSQVTELAMAAARKILSEQNQNMAVYDQFIKKAGDASDTGSH